MTIARARGTPSINSTGVRGGGRGCPQLVGWSGIWWIELIQRRGVDRGCPREGMRSKGGIPSRGSTGVKGVAGGEWGGSAAAEEVVALEAALADAEAAGDAGAG